MPQPAGGLARGTVVNLAIVDFASNDHTDCYPRGTAVSLVMMWSAR
jgi:hypothetical protein